MQSEHWPLFPAKVYEINSDFCSFVFMELNLSETCPLLQIRRSKKWLPGIINCSTGQLCTGMHYFIPPIIKTVWPLSRNFNELIAFNFLSLVSMLTCLSPFFLLTNRGLRLMWKGFVCLWLLLQEVISAAVMFINRNAIPINKIVLFVHAAPVCALLCFAV